MNAIILAGPAVEPVPLAEMKAFLRVDAADEDALVGALIVAARTAVERETRLALIAQTWRVTLATWPAGRFVRLPIGPVTGVTAVTIRDGDTATTVPAGSCRLRLDDEAGILTVDAAAPDPVQNGRIEIDLACGFGATAGAVPEPLRLAIRLLVAGWFARRGDDPNDAADPLPGRVGALLAPFRRARLA